MTVLRPRGCERARLWVSLALDDELSEFEQRLLDAHLERCFECHEYDGSVRETTAALRAEPLAASGRPLVLPRSRSPLGITRVAASAAAAALVAVGVTGFFAVAGGTQRPQVLDRVGQFQGADAAELRALRRSDAGLRQSVRPDHIQIARADKA